MDLSEIPYMLLERELDFGFSLERVWVCLCLVDHLVCGVGCSRQEAMDLMIEECEEKYGDQPDAFKTE